MSGAGMVARWRDALAGLPGRDIGRLLPQARLVGPMPWVIAMMVGLCVLAAAAALALSNVASHARAEIAGGVTVQIVEAAPVARETQVERALALLAEHPAVAAATRVPDARLAALLEPWLGEVSGEDEAIVMPALIDVQLRPEAGAQAVAALERALATEAPAARVDAQSAWLAPVFEALRSLQWLALGLVTLLAALTAAAVGLAARSALSNNRETIEVIHHLGGSDGQIAAIFQQAVARDAVLGAVAGLALGLTAMLLLGRQFAALGSGLVAGGGLGPLDWVLIAAVPVAAVGLAWLTARLTALAALRRML